MGLRQVHQKMIIAVMSSVLTAMLVVWLRPITLPCGSIDNSSSISPSSNSNSDVSDSDSSSDHSLMPPSPSPSPTNPNPGGGNHVIPPPAPTPSTPPTTPAAAAAAAETPTTPLPYFAADSHANVLAPAFSVALEEYHKNVLRPEFTDSTRFLLWRPESGFGNRAMTLSSAFLLAMLNDLVFLVDWEGVSQFLQSPFDDFDWDYLSIHQDELEDDVEEAPSFHMEEGGATKPSWDSIKCGPDDLATLYDGARVIILYSNQYFQPLLFAHSSYHERLQQWFPEGTPMFAPVAQFLIRPAKALHENLEHLWHQKVPDPEKTVGVQIRSFYNHIDSMDTQFVDCVAKEFPQIEAEDDWRIYLATMYPETRAVFVERFGVDKVIFAEAEAAGQQGNDPDHYQSVVLDIFGAAYARAAHFTSSFSTFGYTVAGLSASKNNYIGQTCTKVERRDPCMHSWIRPQWGLDVAQLSCAWDGGDAVRARMSFVTDNMC